MPIFLRWFLRLGPANPITVRLVQNASRRSKHLYVRSAYLAVLILVLLWAMLANSPGTSVSYRELASAGATSFALIAYLQVGLICVIAPVFMAGAIAQEANPKTWDIILTTPMSKLEIVLGNLFGRLFFVLALLFASLPLFALTQFFGGVPGKSIINAYVVSAGAATLVGAIAIALSVSRLAGQRAVFTFYVSVVTYIATTIAIDAWFGTRGMGMGPNGDGVTLVTSLNPFLAIQAQLSPTTYPSADPGLYTGLKGFLLASPAAAWSTFSILISVLLAAFSTLTVRSGGLRKVTQGAAKNPWYRKIFGLGGIDEEHRPPRTVWSNPIAWREAAARNATLGRMLARWSFVILGALTAIVVVILYHTGTLSTNDFRFIIKSLVFTEVFLISLVALNMAATAVAGEREDGTLDLILTTPITPKLYLAGKLRGLVAYLLPLIAVPVFTLLIAGGYSLAGGLGKTNLAEYTHRIPGGNSMQVPVVIPEAGLILAVMLVPFIAFCVMIGLHWSLKSKGTLSAVVGTVAVVFISAGIMGMCGWASAADMPVIGPALATLSPASLIDAMISPVERLDETVNETGGNGLSVARTAMAIGAIVSAGIYIAIVYGVLTAMVRNFDFTVRKLAGTT
jgi:ABC-type transport system involved in multi-copper enzyme maturation permease subunit